MSIASAITAAQGKVADCYTAISNKGGTLPATQNLANMPTAINSIPSGSAPRFGTTIAAYMGPINSYNGQLQVPEEQINGITFTGVQDIGDYALCYKFYYRSVNMTGVVSFPDLKSVSGNYAVNNFCNYTNISGVSFPELETVSGISGFQYAFNSCGYLIGAVSFPKLTTISGNYGLQNIFSGSNITSASFPMLKTISGSYSFASAFASCTELKTIDLSGLEEVSGQRDMGTCFTSCYKLTTVSFDSLNVITGSNVFTNCFQSCSRLSSMYFPSLKTSSFGSNVNQFSSMFNTSTANVSRTCTVHFPSNLQSKVSSLTGYPTFGGNASRIVIAFDLPATS